MAIVFPKAVTGVDLVVIRTSATNVNTVFAFDGTITWTGSVVTLDNAGGSSSLTAGHVVTIYAVAAGTSRDDTLDV